MLITFSYARVHRATRLGLQLELSETAAGTVTLQFLHNHSDGGLIVSQNGYVQTHITEVGFR